MMTQNGGMVWYDVASEDGDSDSEGDDGDGTDGDDGNNDMMVLMRAQVVFIACSMPYSPGEGAEKTKEVA